MSEELSRDKRVGISRRKGNLDVLEGAVPPEEQDQPEYEGTTGELTVYFLVPQYRPKFGLTKKKMEEE